MTILQTKLAELYISFFNRAPDSGGLTYWVDQLDKGALTLEDISKNWMSEQAEGLAKYPSTLTETDFIAQIYQATLGRAPDAEGLAYWQAQLTNNNVGRDVFLAAVINGAKANASAQGVLDAATLSNKATAGVAFADKGLNDLTLAAQVVASVNSNPDTLAAVQAVIKLVPATAADVTPALITLLSQTFDSIINLNAKAPGELGDLATYLTAVANQTTGTTDLSALLANVSTTVTNAATDSAALDNPATLAGDAVAAATPSTGGGDVPVPPIFTVTESLGVVTFSGTATGDIKISIDINGTATFERGGLTAADKVADIAEMVVNLASGQTLAVDSVDVSAASGVTITGAGTFKATDPLSIAQISSIQFVMFAGTKTYALTDSLTNFEGAANGVVSGAASYTLTDAALTAADVVDVTIAGLAAALAASLAAVHSDPIVAGATNGATIGVNYGAYTLADSLAHIAADPGVVGAAASYSLTDVALTAGNLAAVTVAGLAGAQAFAIAAVHSDAIVAAATNAATIVVNNGAYTLADSLTNLEGAANGVVSGATSYTLTDAALTAADVVDVTIAGLAAALAASLAAVHSDPIVAGATNGATIGVNYGAYTLADSLAHIAADPGGVVGAANSYSLTDGIVDLGPLAVSAVAGAEAAAQAIVNGASNKVVDNLTLTATYTIEDTIEQANTLNFSEGYIGLSGLTLTGSFGSQSVTGSAGADTIAGGEGVDTLTGGDGADTFVYTTASDSIVGFFDTITDFASGTDKIQIVGGFNSLNQGGEYGINGTGSLVDDITNAVNSGNDFQFRTPNANDVYVVTIIGDRAGTYVFQDANGNGSVGINELVIQLVGGTTLAAGDIIA